MSSCLSVDFQSVSAGFKSVSDGFQGVSDGFSGVSGAFLHVSAGFLGVSGGFLKMSDAQDLPVLLRSPWNDPSFQAMEGLMGGRGVASY
jgi:hypothetical protein